MKTLLARIRSMYWVWGALAVPTIVVALLIATVLTQEARLLRLAFGASVLPFLSIAHELIWASWLHESWFLFGRSTGLINLHYFFEIFEVIVWGLLLSLVGAVFGYLLQHQPEGRRARIARSAWLALSLLIISLGSFQFKGIPSLLLLMRTRHPVGAWQMKMCSTRLLTNPKRFDCVSPETRRAGEKVELAEDDAVAIRELLTKRVTLYPLLKPTTPDSIHPFYPDTELEYANGGDPVRIRFESRLGSLEIIQGSMKIIFPFDDELRKKLPPLREKWFENKKGA